TTDLQGDMVGDRQDGAATAAPSDKKLGKITSTKVGSIYPTLTPSSQLVEQHCVAELTRLSNQAVLVRFEKADRSCKACGCRWRSRCQPPPRTGAPIAYYCPALGPSSAAELYGTTWPVTSQSNR
ncbi:hypothetical protein, partial [Burkholderia ubonensis]|uniref:hypothetical protein n=1 Tax=Burkholderia ubonensis TaxID=101571 RepID=UPI001C8ABD20